MEVLDKSHQDHVPLFVSLIYSFRDRCSSLVPRPRFSPHMRPGYETTGAHTQTVHTPTR